MSRLTIIGMGFIGTSLGLVLKARKAHLEIVGHDRDYARAGEAKKLGAVDRAEWNLPAALEGAGMVVIATPLNDVEKTLSEIDEFLPDGCVVTDTAPLKAPVLDWAARQLRSNVSFVGGHPIVAEAEEGRKPNPELFRDRAYCVIAAGSARDAAVDQVLRLVNVVGARPMFLDAVEHDSQMAILEQLPMLLASTLMTLATANPSWRDGQLLAGPSFGAATALAQTSAAEQRARLLANREVVLGWIRKLQDELSEVSRLLDEDEADELTRLLDAAQRERLLWRPGVGPQPELPTPELPRARDQLSSLFLGKRGFGARGGGDAGAGRRGDAGTPKRGD